MGDKSKPGLWPEGVQRAFVEGAKWWQFRTTGATAFPSERDEMEAEAVRRYGNPEEHDDGWLVDDDDEQAAHNDELQRLRYEDVATRLGLVGWEGIWKEEIASRDRRIRELESLLRRAGLRLLDDADFRSEISEALDHDR